MHSLFFVPFNQKGETTMDMKKFVNLLLKCDELKDVPMEYIFKVVSSVFMVLTNGNVFYEE